MMKEKSDFDDKLFFTIIKPLSDPLISYAGFALSTEKREEVLNTDFLGRTIAISSRLEEILDHYNAKNNQKWRPFREHIASVKIFSTVSYTTLHLKSTSPQYKLLSGIETFLSDTEGVLDLFSSTLQEIFRELLKSADRNGLKEYRKIKQGFFETVDFPEGRLKSDLKKNRVDSPEKVIVNLATTYLNLASESVLLEEIGQVEYQKYEDLVPDVISENAIRIMENRFHNLQSLYDTYISDTDIEDMDRDLKLIRGHASIVFHLLEASTNIIHYYERHMMNLTGGSVKRPRIRSVQIRSSAF